MTVRGRVTIALFALTLIAGTAALVRPSDPEASAPQAMASVPEAPPVPPPVAAPPPMVPEEVFAAVPTGREALGEDPRAVTMASPDPELPGPLRLSTHFDPDLTAAIWKVLDRGRVKLGHVIVLEPWSGRLLAYVSTDPERFPPTRRYPAASLIKVVTAAAALHRKPGIGDETCRYVGNPYRLSPRRVDPPRSGRSISVSRALAQSNNQCFAQLAVHRIGEPALLDAIDRFGFLRPPTRGHASGDASAPRGDRFALGKLGSGLDGTWITPLHAAQLGGVIATGFLREPQWLDAASDASGRPLLLPRVEQQERVLTDALTRELREMLTETTRRGTARKAFRTRRGHPLLQGIRVAGKTGSLSGRDPDGRYEWFVGAAPAEAPRIVVASVVVQSDLYWLTASQVSAEVLKAVFCPKGVCRDDAVRRFAGIGSESGA